MKYRVTTRGWIVFSLLGVLLLYGIYSIGVILFDDAENTNDHVTDSIAMEQTDELTDVGPIDDSESELPDEDGDTNENDVIEEEQLDDENASDDTSNQPEEEPEQVDLEQSLEIIYDKNVAELKPVNYILLDEWVNIMKHHLDLTITVEGHINGYPYYDDGPYGLGIALERAEKVKRYLVEQGIDESRIVVKNMGSSDQAVKTDDVEEHYKNRRAVLYFNH